VLPYCFVGPLTERNSADEFDDDMSDLQAAPTEKIPESNRVAEEEEEDWDREFEVEPHKGEKS